jgi:hypothetical protein
MNLIDIQKMPKNADCFNCNICDFVCAKYSNYITHLSTLKHKNGIQQDTNGIKHTHLEFECCCGHAYKFRSGLYRHKKKCQKAPKNITNVNDMVLQLINQNDKLQQMLIDQNVKMIELAKESKGITNNTNNNNNTFNLQIYLNDTCKDAVNLVDFVDSLEVKINDLEETARLGYSEGVSRIFINGLNELDVCKRPIHCSDAKRETLYIKDQGTWEKDDTNKTHLTKAIKGVSHKNVDQIFEWQKKYPEYNDPDSKQSDRYMEMISNTICGSKEERDKNLVKIVKNVTKEIIIDKNIE